MTDTLEIKKIIRMKGFTLDTLSKKIGISRTSLSYKINNIVEFNAQEIKHIQKILELSNEQRDHIFFAEAVDKYSTQKNTTTKNKKGDT